MSFVPSIHEPHEASDNALARQAQEGDRAAFAELARRYRPRLVKTLEHRLGGHRADAEDVAQESLATAWQSIARFNPEYQFTTWLYTIALRSATDFHRKGKRHRNPHVLSLHECVDDNQRPPDQTAASRETATNLWSTASQVLTQPQFTALWLRYGEGLAAGEVAKVLGKTTVGVRVLLHRARTRLQPHVLTLHDDASTGPAEPADRSPEESES